MAIESKNISSILYKSIFNTHAKFQEEYMMLDNKIQVNFIVMNSQPFYNLIYCYIKFDPLKLNIEQILHKASGGLYTLKDQLFMIIPTHVTEIEINLAKVKDYINAIFILF